MMKAIQCISLPPGNGAILGNQCWSWLLAHWALSSSCSQFGFGKQKSTLLSPCITYITAIMTTLFTSQLGDDKGSWGKRLTDIHRMDHPMHPTIKHPPLLKLPFGKYSYRAQISLYFLPVQQGPYVFPRIPRHQFLNNVPSPWPARPLATVHKLVYNVTSGYFSFQGKWTTRCSAPSSNHWEDFPLPLFFEDVPEQNCSAVQVVSVYHAEPSVDQAWVFSASINWS